jgi:hypothetical protein
MIPESREGGPRGDMDMKVKLLTLKRVMCFGSLIVLGVWAQSIVASPGWAQSLTACGGIEATPCPEEFTCVDDPRDDCDHFAGGVDCGGICVPARDNDCVAFCRTGGLTGGDFGQCVTDCAHGGVPCGRNVCAPTEVCCNASCGICTPPGWACVQMACSPVE